MHLKANVNNNSDSSKSTTYGHKKCHIYFPKFPFTSLIEVMKMENNEILMLESVETSDGIISDPTLSGSDGQHVELCKIEEVSETENREKVVLKDAYHHPELVVCQRQGKTKLLIYCVSFKIKKTSC